MAASREFVTSVESEDIPDTVGNVRIANEHFERALEDVGPSVTEEVRERYQELEDSLSNRAGDHVEERKVGRTFQ